MKSLIDKLNPTAIIVILLVIIILIIMISNACNYNNALYTNTNQPNGQSTQPVQNVNIVPISNGSVSNKSTLNLYYSNTCPHCVTLLPIWGQIINTNELKQMVNFNQYECGSNSEICRTNNIIGVPTLILFKADGSQIRYPDSLPRSYDGISEFIRNNA